MTRPFSDQFLNETVKIAQTINYGPIECAALILEATRMNEGRLFILGVGGSAANASHAVNDFRKIAGIEAYAPTDNVSELTARTNDEGWSTVFVEWLKESHICAHDTVLVLSVGGGDEEKNISPNLVKALQYAKEQKISVIGIVGRDGGYTAKIADACILVPTVNIDHITPHAESWQAIVWHLLVSHPLLKQTKTKWESINDSVDVSRAVFLDRDGTLTTDPRPRPLLQTTVAPEAFDALARLKRAGFKLVMVTNQPDISRGIISWESVEDINQELKTRFSLDAVYVCPHDDGQCPCRKPKPGMLFHAAEDLSIDLKRSYIVGDSWRDMGAGRRAGCKLVFLRNISTPAGVHSLGGTNTIVSNLLEAADWILEDSK